MFGYVKLDQIHVKINCARFFDLFDVSPRNVTLTCGFRCDLGDVCISSAPAWVVGGASHWPAVVSGAWEMNCRCAGAGTWAVCLHAFV